MRKISYVWTTAEASVAATRAIKTSQQCNVKAYLRLVRSLQQQGKRDEAIAVGELPGAGARC